MTLERRAYANLLKALICYFALSIITIPFVAVFWIGELPVLALIQLPKLWLATTIRTEVVIPWMKANGASRGSFSPDYIAARVDSLIITYAVPYLVLAGVVLARSRFARRYVMLVAVLSAVALLDFFMVWYFGSQKKPGALSMY